MLYGEKFTDEQLAQIKEIIHEETEAQKEKREQELRDKIRSIKDPVERQKAIAENMDLFR